MRYVRLMKKLLLTGIAVLFLATGTAHAKKPLTPKQVKEYKALIGAGITKKDAARVVRDPGVKKGEWGWTCEDMMAVRVKADGAPGYPISSLVKYKNNVVCE
jgi:hypothetical protein